MTNDQIIKKIEQIGNIKINIITKEQTKLLSKRLINTVVNKNKNKIIYNIDNYMKAQVNNVYAVLKCNDTKEYNESCTTPKWVKGFYGIVKVTILYVNNKGTVTLTVKPYIDYLDKYEHYIPSNNEILEILTTYDLKDKYFEYLI